MLLVDTYDTLRSGVPNAITVFRELREKGFEPVGIRLDSGDLSYLSRTARKMLDEAGFPQAKIFASGDLDEDVIWDLIAQGAKIDVWGVGTRLITSQDNPALGGVYKLAAEEIGGVVHPRIKISENPQKITNPGLKTLYRIYDGQTKKALADLIALAEEEYDASKPLKLFDPENTWKTMTVTDYIMRPLLTPIFLGGELVYKCPGLMEIQQNTLKEMDTFWGEYKRLQSPHRYKVDLSQPLYDLKQKLLSLGGEPV
jgi:nicotinate phosphoribosyltransferase